MYRVLIVDAFGRKTPKNTKANHTDQGFPGTAAGT